MKVVFTKEENISEGRICITGKQFSYLKKVLRFKKGEEIELKTKNKAYLCKLDSFSRDSLYFGIEKSRELRKASFKIIVCQSLIKEKSFIFALQKLTELGVSTIIPYYAKCSVVHIEDEKQKLKRWGSICIGAAEQSRNDSYPYIGSIIKDIEDLRAYELANKIILNEKEKTSTLKEVFNRVDPYCSILIMVGPEGGFTAIELEKARSLGFFSVSMGSSILRSETASIVAVSNLLYHFSL